MLKILGATLYKFSHTSDQAPGFCASLLTNLPPSPRETLGLAQLITSVCNVQCSICKRTPKSVLLHCQYFCRPDCSGV